MKIVKTKKAPEAIGPYSQAVKVGKFVFCSGQIGIDPKTGELVDGLEKQAKQIFKNIKAVLEASKTDVNHVVKTTIFLTDVSKFQQVNSLYAEFFGKHKPTRSTVEVSKLPKGALLEIEAIAVV